MDAITARLLERHQNVCNEIVNRFCKKQDLEFEYWIGDEVGGLAVFLSNECFLNFHDILVDLSKEAPKGKILDWYYEMSDRHLRGNETHNYASYVMNNCEFIN